MPAPILLWIKREFRLDDHPALAAAAESGVPVIAVVIRDAQLHALPAAPAFRMHRAIRAFSDRLIERGSALVLRSGPPAEVLASLARETGARAVHWTRGYAADEVARDTEVKATLIAAGLSVQSFPGRLLLEPWQIETKSGSSFKVFTPFWRTLSAQMLRPAIPEPARLNAPARWPESETLESWRLSAPMQRGAAVVGSAMMPPGEAAAQAQAEAFCSNGLGSYANARDVLAETGTSRLSAALSFGEISPIRLWELAGQTGTAFRRQLAWRDFAWHLMWHFPALESACWREAWEGFPWQREGGVAFERWCRGETGEDIVDAAMRELYVTGHMHNRARMIVASYLTKHLLIDWRLGLEWFRQTLVDFDPACNAMGWQWVAGCGPDAAPYFRILNPSLQAQKFDPEGRYRRRWLGAESGFFDAVPRAWALDPTAPRPSPMLSLAEGRARALDALQQMKR